MAEQIELDVQGHRLVAKSFNKNKDSIPVVFIHGITASINFWEPIQIPIFRKRFCWYSLSLPGHYPAIFPGRFQTEAFTSDVIIDVLSEAIRNLVGEQPVIVVGHSTGGFAAVGIAGRNPHMVAGVISISGFAQGRWRGALGLLQKIASLSLIGPCLFRTCLSSLVAHRSIYRFAAGVYAKDRKALYSYPHFENLFDVIYADAKRLQADSLFPFFKRLPDIDISELLPRVSAPTLVIAGDSDPIVPPEQSRKIAEKVLNGELCLLKGGGHLPMFEKSQQYNEVIERWVKGIIWER